MNSSSTDFCIIGAGVIGCAVARRVAAFGKSVLVLEAAERSGTGITSRNSEVIHAGFYYPTGSLKARLCVEGQKLLYQFLAARNLPHRKIGKLVVAIEPSQIAELTALHTQGNLNGVGGLKLIDSAAARQLEPEVQAAAALFSSGSGIISAHDYCAALENEARASGVDFAYHTLALGLNRRGSNWEVFTRNSRGEEFLVTARWLINCAGLNADKIAALAGIDIEEDRLQQYWVKGEYFALSSGWGKKLSHLIYPLPETNLRGLGVHITLDLAGQARLGPNVLETERKEDYSVNEKHREQFFEAARKFLPGLSLDELSPYMAGLRPKLSQPGESARDFYIQEESERDLAGFVNLLGIESPGLTASLAIADYVANLIQERS